jgi:hypothetical protein
MGCLLIVLSPRFKLLTSNVIFFQFLNKPIQLCFDLFHRPSTQLEAFYIYILLLLLIRGIQIITILRCVSSILFTLVWDTWFVVSFDWTFLEFGSDAYSALRLRDKCHIEPLFVKNAFSLGICMACNRN